MRFNAPFARIALRTRYNHIIALDPLADCSVVFAVFTVRVKDNTTLVKCLNSNFFLCSKYILNNFRGRNEIFQMYSKILIVLFVKNGKNIEYQKKIHENRLIYRNTNKRLTLRTYGNYTFIFRPPTWGYDGTSDPCIIFNCTYSASNKID